MSAPAYLSSVTLRHLPDEQEWLLAPVLHGFIKYESLKDGTLDLCDVAELNDALACRQDNEARIAQAVRTENERQRRNHK